MPPAPPSLPVQGEATQAGTPRNVRFADSQQPADATVVNPVLPAAEAEAKGITASKWVSVDPGQPAESTAGIHDVLDRDIHQQSKRQKFLKAIQSRYKSKREDAEHTLWVSDKKVSSKFNLRARLQWKHKLEWEQSLERPPIPAMLCMQEHGTGDPLVALGGERESSESAAIVEKLEALDSKRPPEPLDFFPKRSLALAIRRWCMKVRKNHWYITCFAVVIVADAMSMALKTDKACHPQHCWYAEASLNVFFVFDLFLHTFALADLKPFTLGRWLFEAVVTIVAGSDVWVFNGLILLGIMRRSEVPRADLFRLLRITRLGHLLPLADDFGNLLDKSSSSSGESTWNERFRPVRIIVASWRTSKMMVLCIVLTAGVTLYLFALVARILILFDMGEDSDAPLVQLYFRSVGDAFLTIVNLATGTLMWEERVYESFKEDHILATAVVYVSQIVLVLFYAGAMKAVAIHTLTVTGDAEDAKEEFRKQTEKFNTRRIKHALQRMDVSGDGYISRDELRYCFERDPALAEDLGMELAQVEQLHADIDGDGGGRVSFGLLMLSLFSSLVSTNSLSKFIQEHQMRQVQSVVQESMVSTTKLTGRLYDSLYLQSKLLDAIEQIEMSYQDLVQPVKDELVQVEASMDTLVNAVALSQASASTAIEREDETLVGEGVKRVETLKFVGSLLVLQEALEQWTAAEGILPGEMDGWDPVKDLDGQMKNVLEAWRDSDDSRAPHEVEEVEEDED